MLFAATAALIALATPGLCVSAASAAERPPVIGPHAAVSAGHPLTSAAALEVLTRGGNAFDAGVAALLVGGVVEQDNYSLGGEALVLVYPKIEHKVTSVVGQGWAPKNATIDAYVGRGGADGHGLNPAVCLARSSVLTVLERWGTMELRRSRRAQIDMPSRAFRSAAHGDRDRAT
jgi:gamma-glutamyltranspeptidase/glutathione hydrolase